MGGAGGAVQTQQQFKNGGAQTQADASQKTDDTGSSPSADQSSSTTTTGRPSTPPLSVEQSQKLIHNMMNRPPEQRGHPTTQADLAQAQWVVREQVRKLESQKEPLNETQKKALADAKAALARVGAESDRGPTSQPITDDRSNAPAVKWIVPQQPHHLKPSMPYDANRKPRGSPKKLGKKDTDFHNERGVNGENEAANVLAQHGYDYEQIREANKSPDGKVSGVADKWDTYAPHAGKNMRGIRDFIVDKVDRQNAPYVVIRLEPNGQDVNDIAAHLRKFPVDGLKQLFHINNGQLYILY